MDMSKTSPKNKKQEDPEMLAEYDFSQGVRGKHCEAYRKGHSVKIHKADGTTVVQHFTMQDGAVMLEPDVREYFPDSKAVNEALRMLIKIIPKTKRRASGQKRAA
jgi:hypothetical protein